MLFIFCLFNIISSIDGIYQSTIQISSTGFEYQPKYSIQLISTTIIPTTIRCSAACNQLSSCRTFDYDLVSKRCRLFEGDSTTGSVISSSSSTSLVGTVLISSSLYSPTHNQPCQTCQDTRYEVCLTNTSTCQCPTNTYWNGSICALQLFPNDTCGQSDACRSDLNLTCTTDCYRYISTCLPSFFNNITLPSMRVGVTVAGACNGSSTTNQTLLITQSDVMLGFNNTMYVGDNSNQLYLFYLNNRTGSVLRSFASWSTFMFLDNRTSFIYGTLFAINLVYIWPTNQTIPPNGITYNNCSMQWVYTPTGIAVDSIGNVYIASAYCNWIMKWAPNATNATVFAGSSSGVAGVSSMLLYYPYGLAIDGANLFIYVADRYNFRVQRFPLSGPAIGVTVAGGNGAGSAANQLNRPSDVNLSPFDGSIYVADSFNNRVQKWQVNATVGVTVAGNPNGIAGFSPYLMNLTYGIAVDDQEKYLYVSDSKNNRIQRFSLQ